MARKKGNEVDEDEGEEEEEEEGEKDQCVSYDCSLAKQAEQ